MHRTLVIVLTLAVTLMAAPAIGSLTVAVEDDMLVTERYHDEQGNLLYEVGIMLDDPLLGFTRHYIHLAPSSDGTHKENHGGPGGGGGGDGGGGGNDCPATQYKLGGWHWTSPYSARSGSYASVLDGDGKTWDAATSGSVFGGITSGNDGTAGVQDFKNNIEWTDLGSSSTIAVTTTWYYRGSGEAVESDAQYNTFYTWSTNGDPDAMDVSNIGTHELGHSFGLGHPNGSSSTIGCLTMYAYADFGETQKSTLGTGDILGIQAIYG